MLLALSASYSEIDTFEWYTYKAPRGTSLISPKSRVTLREGDVFGIKELRGGRYRVILPEAYKQNFTLEDIEGTRLIQKSKSRRAPKIEEELKLKRVFNLDKHSQAASFRAWDSDYFKAARKVTSEARDGVDFSNYQWRKLHPNATLKIEKTSSKFIVVPMGSVIGVRFLVPAKGGIFIDRDGKRMSLSPDMWKQMLEKTTVLPKSKWPEGSFTVDQMKAAMQQDVDIRKQQTKEQKRLEKEEAIAEKRAKADAAQRQRAKIAREKKEEADKLAIKRDKAKLAEAKRKKELKPREIDHEAVAEYHKNLNKREQKEALEDIDLDFSDDESLDDDLDLDEASDKKKLDKILDIPEDADLSDDAVDPIAMLDEVVKEKRAASPINLKDFGDDEEDEDEEDEDDDDVEYEDDEEEDEDDEEEEDDPDAEYEDADADIDEAEGDTDDEDAEAADEELEETEDDVEGDDAEYRADEGDVITFKSDDKDNRDFAILSIYPFSQNNSIMIYKVYDMTTEPEGFQTIRINTKQKRKFEDMVTFQRKLEGKEHQELLDLTDDYSRIAEPIVS